MIGNEKGTVNRNLFIILMIAAAVVVFSIGYFPSHAKTPDQRLWLGLETIELTPDIKKQFDIQSSNGLLVSRTFNGSPAQIAGIQEGDVLRRWNGVSVTSQDQLQYLIQTSGGSDRIKISIDRQGKPVLVYCSVGVRPGGI